MEHIHKFISNAVAIYIRTKLMQVRISPPLFSSDLRDPVTRHDQYYSTGGADTDF